MADRADEVMSSASVCCTCSRQLLCRFSDAGNWGLTMHCGGRAAEKRQGTKSRGVEHRSGSKRYGDLMVAPPSVVDATLSGFQVHGRPGECAGHFDPAWEGINGRPRH